MEERGEEEEGEVVRDGRPLESGEGGGFPSPEVALLKEDFVTTRFTTFFIADMAGLLRRKRGY